MLKTCKEHGFEKVLISTDAEYYKKCREFIKTGQMPLKFNTKVKKGCPHDCGLCPDHEQHSCVTILEITDKCNLKCPTCYANSDGDKGRHKSMDEINNLLDAIIENEGEPDVVQLSGGEPTIHPDFFEILDEVKKRPIQHVMVDTNGIIISQDEEFAKKLAEYMPDFEIYLQFDSLNSESLRKIRGANLTDVRRKALENLNKFNVSTTLVVVVQKEVNDKELGNIIKYATKQDCVRGVTFQPVQIAGRSDENSENERITLTEVRQNILDQCDIFREDDILPVPCNPDAITMGYAFKFAGMVKPLTDFVDPKELLKVANNTIAFEQDEKFRDFFVKLFSTGNSPSATANFFKYFSCCDFGSSIPKMGYDKIFRIVIIRFMDAYDFDVRVVKKSCVHILNDEGKFIPFETMNLFHRNKLKHKTRISITN